MFTKAVFPYQLINRYKRLADGIGVVDGPLIFMAYPLLGFLKIPFPTRMTVIKLANGELWLHSPIAFEAQFAATLSEMGPIRHIVSPDKIHYAHIEAWKDAFPGAIAWASPGVRERARSKGIGVRFDDDLGKKPPEAWQDELSQTIIPGCFLDEVLFFHKASRTLILADGIQNFELDKIKQPYRFLVWAAGAYHPHGQMPIDLRSTFWPKGHEVGLAACEMLSWRPARIIPSHGRCIEDGAETALRYAFRWAL